MLVAVVAVLALPVKLPVTLPVTLPVILPTKPVVDVTLVPVIAAGVTLPIAVASIVPPSPIKQISPYAALQTRSLGGLLSQDPFLQRLQNNEE